jgi:hypothetical protein
MKFIDCLDVYIHIQNIQLIKLICYTEDWNYLELLKLIKND